MHDHPDTYAHCRACGLTTTLDAATSPGSGRIERCYECDAPGPGLARILERPGIFPVHTGPMHGPARLDRRAILLRCRRRMFRLELDGRGIGARPAPFRTGRDHGPGNMAGAIRYAAATYGYRGGGLEKPRDVVARYMPQLDDALRADLEILSDAARRPADHGRDAENLEDFS